jgi:hypothetical protein
MGSSGEEELVAIGSLGGNWQFAAALVAAGGIGGLLVGLLAGTVRGLLDPVDIIGAAGPVKLLRLDRSACLIAVAMTSMAIVAVLLLVAFVFDVSNETVSRWVLTILVVCCAIAVPLRFAWARFAFARLRLALMGKVPWRLMVFLEDARTRGVLRQEGGVYSFRHQRLRDYLSRLQTRA